MKSAMNTKTTFAIIATVAILAAAITPTLMTDASAAIRDACQKNGRTSDGECTGNTDRNGKNDVRLNPANKAPPGQN
jgi:uncharacterized membrane protein